MIGRKLVIAIIVGVGVNGSKSKLIIIRIRIIIIILGNSRISIRIHIIILNRLILITSKRDSLMDNRRISSIQMVGNHKDNNNNKSRIQMTTRVITVISAVLIQSMEIAITTIIAKIRKHKSSRSNTENTIRNNRRIDK